MDIEFIGYAISDGRLVKSDCILQGIKAGINRIYLKHELNDRWVEVKPETVKQTRYDNRDTAYRE
jgi:hypothetical protein